MSALLKLHTELNLDRIKIELACQFLFHLLNATFTPVQAVSSGLLVSPLIMGVTDHRVKFL